MDVEPEKEKEDISSEEGKDRYAEQEETSSESEDKKSGAKRSKVDKRRQEKEAEESDMFGECEGINSESD